MSESESISIKPANNSINHGVEEKKSEALKEMRDIEVGIESSRDLTIGNSRKQTTDCCQTKIPQTDSQGEEKKLRVNQYKRKKTLSKSPKVGQTGEAGKPLKNIAAKEKADDSTSKTAEGIGNLCVDLTSADVKEYFPQSVKVNLGHRCDSSAFHVPDIKKVIPSTDDHGDKKVINNLEGVEAEGNASIIKKNEINRKPTVPQLSSSASNPVEKSSSNFKMIRFDYKKDAEKKTLAG